MYIHIKQCVQYTNKNLYTHNGGGSRKKLGAQVWVSDA